MTERPILFSGSMVRAIRAGTKTQTRRVVKRNATGRAQLKGRNWHLGDPDAVKACPYGQPGDRLWVQESWSVLYPQYVKDSNEPTFYKADAKPGEILPRWRPSIHMPRSRCRLVLEITAVRVERLQDISDADVDAEGVSPMRLARGVLRDDWRPQDAYARLWDSLNDKTATWASNPWVWVVEFRRCTNPTGGNNG